MLPICVAVVALSSPGSDASSPRSVPTAPPGTPSSAQIDALMGDFEFRGGVEERRLWAAALEVSVTSSRLRAKTVRGRLNRIASIAGKYHLRRRGDEICMTFPWVNKKLKSRMVTMCAPPTEMDVDTTDPDGDAITIAFAVKDGCLTQSFSTWSGTRKNTMCPEGQRFISTVEVSSMFLRDPFVHVLTYDRTGR